MPHDKIKLPQPHPRFARLEARISPAQKELFQQAAAISGRTLTDFIIGCVAQEAKRIVDENEIIKLTGRDREVFVAALLNPPAPNKALRKATKLHDRLIGDDL